jgi:M6 family metalloprotease-like protein
LRALLGRWLGFRAHDERETVMADPQVSIHVPESALFVGSFVKVPVLIGRGSGLTLDDLEFVVRPRRAGRDTGGCAVSLSRDLDFDAEHPDVMLLAGYQPGNYRLAVLDKVTGGELAVAPFSVDALWSDDSAGPGRWVAGDFRAPGIAGAAWGGGSASEPENFEVAPAIGVRKVAVLLVDTSSQRFATAPPESGLWEEVAFTGRTIGGATVSAAHYYREASYDQLDLQGDVHGPASLPGAWSDYFLDTGEPKGEFWQACVTAGDSLVNYGDVDFVACVVRSVDATATTDRLGVWPWANAIMAKTADGDLPLGMVAIHADGDFLGLVATLCHELGHDLELGGDVYPWVGHTPQIKARQMDGWDIMAVQGGLPHPCLVHRMRMGWVPKSAVRLYNFQTIAGYVDETVTLHPLERAHPPFGTYSGIEVRIAPGWNYYFEYRAAQAGQIGDQHLPEDQRVLGTDVMYAEDMETITRRKPVLLLETDADGDGPVLAPGEDYQDQDTSSGIPTDFSITVLSADSATATVRIRYGVSSQPDPSIRRWSPPVYRSPDIQIRNARSDADPRWLDVPWENHHNRVIATVTNHGAMNAPGVHLDFSVFDLTTDTAPQQPQRFGDDTHDVPAMSSVPFETTWRPLKGGHYCVEARIRHYQTPGPNSVIEGTEFNNVAQSNYDEFISATGSPASREMTSVKVHNPYDVELRVHLRTVASSSPLFRTYVEHTWVVLGPGESRGIRVMFEYAFVEDPVHVPELERYLGKPNDVAISAFAQFRTSPPSEAHLPAGGVSVRVHKGRATTFEPFGLDFPVVFGRVVTTDTHEPVTEGTVIVTVSSDRTETSHPTALTADGRFSLRVEGSWDTAAAYYLPVEGFADAYSEAIDNPR